MKTIIFLISLMALTTAIKFTVDLKEMERQCFYEVLGKCWVI